MAYFWKTLIALHLSCICIGQISSAFVLSKEITRPFGSLKNTVGKPLQGLNSREDEEDEEYTTVKGPGHEGILNGLSGIFAGVVNGNLNGIVESSFQFVPKAHHPNVNKVYSSLLGKTDPPPTVKPTLRSVVANNNEEAEEEEEAAPSAAASAPIRRRPLPPRRPLQQVNPDDEEEEADFLQRQTARPIMRYRPKPAAARPKATPAPAEDYSV